MRKHGWQLPYHPLQVVAIAVFLALGVAFYVFFMPFVGKKLFQHLAMGIYTPLVTLVFCLYIWCAAADPGDPGVFKSKKYLNVIEHCCDKYHQESSKEDGSIYPKKESNVVLTGSNTAGNAVKMEAVVERLPSKVEKDDASKCYFPFSAILFLCYPLSFLGKWTCSNERSSEQQSSEDGMFYCSLCEVEVFKYSKHCRVCDKCVDGFDHHCRWLNNCIGKKNYKYFFILMAFALLLLILQWSLGIVVLVRCFIARKQFGFDIASKLGSSFSFVPFVFIVVSCTILAMVATLPLAQLLFFHILLVKKGISTYDYIIALREQEQQEANGQQSPQMSSLSSLTGLSSASSFNTFRRGAWCTPPRLFLEDQFDVIPTDNTGVGKKLAPDGFKKVNTGTVKINPWTLARLNAEEVSKAAAQARKKSKILQPVVREKASGLETDSSSFDNGSGRMVERIDTRRRGSKRTAKLPANLLNPLAKIPAPATEGTGSDVVPTTSRSLAPLQLEARDAFHKSLAMSSAGIVAYSPDSSLDSPELHPFRASLSGPEEDAQGLGTVSSSAAPCANLQTGIQLSRSTSDGYEASGGEDSDRVAPKIVHRSLNWSNMFFNTGPGDVTNILRGATSTGFHSTASSRML